MLDQFQMELQNLLRKYNKEIKVSIQPIIVDVPQQQSEVSEEVIQQVLKGPTTKKGVSDKDG